MYAQKEYGRIFNAIDDPLTRDMRIVTELKVILKQGEL